MLYRSSRASVRMPASSFHLKILALLAPPTQAGLCGVRLSYASLRPKRGLRLLLPRGYGSVGRTGSVGTIPQAVEARQHSARRSTDQNAHITANRIKDHARRHLQRGGKSLSWIVDREISNGRFPKRGVLQDCIQLQPTSYSFRREDSLEQSGTLRQRRAGLKSGKRGRCP